MVFNESISWKTMSVKERGDTEICTVAEKQFSLLPNLGGQRERNFRNL